MNIRSVMIDHSTIQRWVYKHAPLIEKSMHKRKNRVCINWSMGETDIKFAGKDKHHYRAVDKFGDTEDFLLTKRRMKGSTQNSSIKPLLIIRIPGLFILIKVIVILLLLELLTELISRIKTTKLDDVNTLIIVRNKTTETSREGLL
jgi:hypothetical protein